MKEKKVFIFCYDNCVTGGPEALHQLRYYMEQQGIDASMVYLDRSTEDAIVPDRYLQYFPNGLKYIGEKNYHDDKTNLIIMPEAVSFRLFRYPRSSKAIWFLGVWAHDGARVFFDPAICKTAFGRLYKKIKVKLTNTLNSVKCWYLYKVKKAKNYCGSKYAYEYLTDVRKQKAHYLVEPISLDFLHAGGVFDFSMTGDRDDCVLYNPSKPSELMKQLLDRNRFHYVPLSGYTPSELIVLYRKSKLYVDFGGFPGPERIPKETVYNGCNIIVGKKNAAENDFDVAIPEEYKLSDPTAEEVEYKISEMLEQYENRFYDFGSFRKKIDNLEANFIEEIKLYFSEYISQ